MGGAMKNFRRFNVFSNKVLKEAQNFLSICIEEEIPILLAKQFLDDYFNKNLLHDKKIGRINYMTTAKYGKPCCGDKK